MGNTGSKINDVNIGRKYDDFDEIFGGKSKMTNAEIIEDTFKSNYVHPLMSNTAHFYLPWNFTLGEAWATRQGSICADFEIDFYRCLSVAEQDQKLSNCREYFKDLHECTFETKQNERLLIMEKVRQKKRFGYKPAPPTCVVINPPID
ncbi:hypothetical protein A3Q56_02870 [Intoshia linei]|uniref:NADH dehydrogenase [ubiquinone] iron-sulfur protein 5 n=1 Tax=Intoshia linei TaxID=1819745 RepID=A0A177B7I5_9BILA|nr:hypothetical protein A3Q56_02870 [Intoshia linei]